MTLWVFNAACSGEQWSEQLGRSNRSCLLLMLLLMIWYAYRLQ